MKKHPRKIPPPPKPPALPGITQHSLGVLKEVQAELKSRKVEALRLYRPMPHQELMHASRASERIVLGGNRCLSGDQLIWDPVCGQHRKVSEIDDWFWVQAVHQGRVVTANAKRPFVKGWDHLYAFRLSNGGEIRCTLNHLVLDAGGAWRPVGDVLLPECVSDLLRTTGGTYLPVSPGDAPHYSDTGRGSLGGCQTGPRLCDGQPPQDLVAAQSSPHGSGDAPGCSQTSFGPGDPARTQACTLPCLWCGHPSSPDAPAQTLGPAAAFGSQTACTPCSQTWGSGPATPLSRPLSSFPAHTRYASAPPASQSCCEDPCRSPIGGGEHVYITAYRYLGRGEVWDFSVPLYHNYLIDGVANHNSGKSLSTFVEDARALTGQDPHEKYPKEGGNLVVIGRNWPHIGLVCYPMLFKAGAFRMIKDLETGEWRAFDPVGDAERKAESKPAPPLVPPRFVAETSWVLKNAGYCQRVVLSNGWTVHFFSSEGEPPQGFQADLVHLDEDISNPSWVGEMQARLADRKGRLMWSAMPHSKNDALLGLCERADKEREDGVEPPKIEKFVYRFLDNAHIDQEEKEKNIARWSALGVDELRMRAEGEFTQDSILMYPNFNPAVHMLALEGGVPHEWTRYVAIDPGHTVMACVFGAVPPDERFLLIYDELYIRNANALIWGEEFARKVRDQHIYAAIMDMHGGTLRDLGSGRLPCDLYSEQLRNRKIRFQLGGHQFIPGSDDIVARTSLVRQMLHIRGDGSTQLKFLEGATPELIREIKRYKKKVIQSNSGAFVTDMPNTRGEVHAVQCFDDQTEVLTESGWKLFKDVPDAQRVATVNLQTGFLEYQHFTQRVEKPHDGEMVRIKSARVDAHVTPDHRMVTLNKKGEIAIREAGDLRITDRFTNQVRWDGLKRDGPVLLPGVSGGKREFEKEIDPLVWAEFLGWFLSEGYVDKTPRCPGSGYRVVIAQKKPTTKAFLRCNLSQLPFRWVETPDGFQASSKQLWESLIDFGGTADKYIPQWILDSDTSVLRAFLDGALDGDGWTAKGTHLPRYGSASRRLADGIQEVMLKLGMSPSLYAQPAGVATIRGKECQTREFYRVAACRQRPISLRDAYGTPSFEPSDYTGNVYCLSVPNTTLMVRRGGVPIIAGNCLEYLCAYEPSYHQPPSTPAEDPWWVKWLAERKKRRGEDGKGYVCLGPTRKG